MESFLQAINYKITDGDNFGWNCYGVSAYILSTDQNVYSASCVFDTKTQEIFDISLVDYNKELAYRWINDLYRDAYKQELTNRNFESDMATDEIEYIEVSIIDDIIEKITAVCNGEDYDTGILVPFEISDDLYEDLTKLAEEKNMSISDLVKEAIMLSIEQYEKQDETSDNLPNRSKE